MTEDLMLTDPGPCSLCQETPGWVRVANEQFPDGAMQKCQCRIFAEKMAQVNRLLHDSKLGKRFMRRTFDNFIPAEGTKRAYDISLDYVERYEELSNAGRGLTFIGDVGTGKTHLAGAILQEVIRQKQAPGVLVYVPDLLDKIRETYNGNYKSVSSKKLMELITSVDFLVLDDLGAEKPTPWVQERLTLIINNRYENLLPTIVTSNLLLKCLEDQIGRRIVSRLIEMNISVQLTGKDYRRNK